MVEASSPVVVDGRRASSSVVIDGEIGLLLPVYEAEKCGVLYIFLMSTSMVLCHNFRLFGQNTSRKPLYLHGSSRVVVQLSGGRRRFCGFIPNARKRHSRKRSWWQKFFFDEDGNWLGLRDEEMIEAEESGSASEELSEGEKFEAWRRRAEAIMELREAQDDTMNKENRRWEDWVDDKTDGFDNSSWVRDWRDGHGESGGDGWEEPSELLPPKDLVKSVRDLVLGREDEDMLYEDRVFRFASFNSAKFLAVLIILPWALDFFVHDYVLMPFLDRYVKTVPLAAQILDVRRHQKLEMVEELKLERAKFRLEVEIGKSPPLSDEELWLELRHKALELREERRLENRRAFANIWSDMIFGVSLFILLYFNQSKVALLKFTGYKIVNNISDTGKAFLIILVTDIFLGSPTDEALTFGTRSGGKHSDGCDGSGSNLVLLSEATMVIMVVENLIL
ncbi:hypothetical protein RJ639_015219 [Escallonia herrerae]|uniref:Chloroplast envelope membrane protein n=1 Tax=Escallonia herrerae TaxID=1293975 RepID=A0AA88VJZ6_9ASTE|nr:hypothetical protein RJ639_015219 [Escallonia herrerae]